MRLLPVRTLLAGGVVLGAFSAGLAGRATGVETGATGDDGCPCVSTTGVEAGTVASGQVVRLPETARVTRHYPDGTTERVDDAVPASTDRQEKLIYSNTLGDFLYSPGAGIPIADDLVTEAVTDCAIHRITFRVNGGVEEGDEEFSVSVGVWDKCPALRDAENLLGDEITFDQLADNDEETHELVIDFRDMGICDNGDACSVLHQDCPDASPCVQNLPELPPTVWLSYRFSTNTAGVIAGSPAQIGFSADYYHDVYCPCTSWLGGYPRFPHSSFWAQVYADGTTDEADPDFCPTGFFAYAAVSRSFSDVTDYVPPSGVTTRVADAIVLTGGQGGEPIACELSAVEIGFIGEHGPFEMDVDLRWPGLDDVIEGTQRTFTGTGEGELEVARFLFEPGVFIEPTDQPIYITWQTGTGGAWARHSSIDLGLSWRSFWTQHIMPGISGEWLMRELSSLTPVSFYAVVQCRGEPPTGACCRFPGELEEVECSDGVTHAMCLGGRWVRDRTCAEDPFDPPCGMARCCLPDATCENLTRDECEQADGYWRERAFCGDYGQRCYWRACGYDAPRDCSYPALLPGCHDLSCCTQVCMADPWCCENNWDEQCVEEAFLLCDHEPYNDYCCNSRPLSLQGQLTSNNARAYGPYDDPGFHCHPDGAGTLGYGPIWFKFEATETSARFHTCASDDTAGDSLLQVYAIEPDDESCENLIPLACSDDAPGCGADGLQSDVCVTGLEPGASYRVQLASKNAEGRGWYRLVAESPCPQAAGSNAGDSDFASIILEPEPGDSSPAPPGASHTARADDEPRSPALMDPAELHNEIPDDAPVAVRKQERSEAFCDAGSWERGMFSTVQVNVDEHGHNIVGDAANEPSIAISAVDPDVIVIGWRQFDTIESNFRQAGWAYSHDAGATWTFPGVLEPGVFRSDPVLAADADGNIHYYSLTLRDPGYVCDMFTSYDDGVSWGRKVYARGGDKPWIAIDQTSGPGRNHIYALWSSSLSCCSGHFTRSIDGGQTYSTPIDIPLDPHWGTVAVGLDGAIYATGRIGSNASVVRSTNASDPAHAPVFDQPVMADVGGLGASWTGPNPGGLLGQGWVATDHSHGAGRGNVYILTSATLDRDDPLDLMFARSTDSGLTWSEPVRINDDPVDSEAWQWFGTMSVAPNGRIDVVWNDTRNTGVDNLSGLFYSFSIDGGVTWTENVPISPVFDSHAGWPQQNKLGDYYDMISDNAGANLAYAATFNGEQDIYFARIEPDVDCNDNGIPDITEIAGGSVADCDGDLVPDECSPDFDGDGYINGCDFDIDNDGVSNDFDVCNFTPLGAIVTGDGSQRGDFMSDCDIDLRDFRSYRACLLTGGPAEGDPSTDCLAAFDFDGDADIDLADGRLLLNDFTGLIRRAPDTLVE